MLSDRYFRHCLAWQWWHGVVGAGGALLPSGCTAQQLYISPRIDALLIYVFKESVPLCLDKLGSLISVLTGLTQAHPFRGSIRFDCTAVLYSSLADGPPPWRTYHI